jgi:hypothetical protein
MHLKEAQDKLAVRLYEWSLQDCRRELTSDCPFLSLVGLNDRYVAGFVEWVKTLSLAERQALANARVRYAHEYAASLKGEALPNEEAKQWNKLVYEQSSIREQCAPPLVSADRRLPTFRPINPDHCLDAVIASASSVLGKVSRRGRSSVHCSRQIGDWKLVTDFIFIRRDEYLQIDHQFVRKDGTPVIGHNKVPFPPHRSLFFFWGLTGTMVSVPSEQDGRKMAKVMPTLAEYFVSQAEPFFAGLGLLD